MNLHFFFLIANLANLTYPPFCGASSGHAYSLCEFYCTFASNTEVPTHPGYIPFQYLITIETAKNFIFMSNCIALRILRFWNLRESNHDQIELFTIRYTYKELGNYISHHLYRKSNLASNFCHTKGLKSHFSWAHPQCVDFLV